jgi:Ca-activated chloride channel family protein
MKRAMVAMLGILPGLLLLPGSAGASGFADLWLTPDQQGDRLLAQARFPEAAEAYEDPARRAAAWYRGGDFERAAAVWGSLATAEAAFNRGNALVFLGRYEEAIASYDLALDRQADWPEARENREIARLRLERLQPPDDDAGGTGGKLGADEIRFDDTGRVDKAGSEETVEEQQAVGDEEMRAVWLRRVEDKPADFLRARFSYQLFRDEQETGDAPRED